MSAIRTALEAARRAGGIGLIPFVPAGFPDLGTTAECIRACASSGATAIEIGFPFSDPVADGPVIQEAFTAALANGTKVDHIFAAVRPVSGELRIPLVAMLSYSIVFRYGTERFVHAARDAGLAGLILPDLPPPEADSICALVRAAGLDTVLLVAPTTAPERRARIARLCSGFVYYLSVSGITGERDSLPEDLERNVSELRRAGDAPVCVGFGIHRREQLLRLRGIADGAIVGTAVVRRMKDRMGDGQAAIARAVGDYCDELQPS